MRRLTTRFRQDNTDLDGDGPVLFDPFQCGRTIESIFSQERFDRWKFVALNLLERGFVLKSKRWEYY